MQSSSTNMHTQACVVGLQIFFFLRLQSVSVNAANQCSPLKYLCQYKLQSTVYLISWWQQSVCGMFLECVCAFCEAMGIEHMRYVLLIQ